MISLAKVIGLTGSIASGKSTVSNKLKSIGYQVIDCDQINHEILKKDNIGYTLVVEAFGNDILNYDLEINRKALGNLIFSNKDLKEKLNNILHPLIKDIVKKYNNT